VLAIILHSQGRDGNTKGGGCKKKVEVMKDLWAAGKSEKREMALYTTKALTESYQIDVTSGWVTHD
jgi:hypothetical protein